MPCASAYLALAHRPARLYRGRPMPPGYRPCVGSGFAAQVLGGWEPYLRSCSSRPAVVPAFAAAILQQRRSTFCAPAHLDWRTVPRGRCRRGVIHRLVVVAVAGVSQGFRGRHWSAARSTGGTELVGQYSLRKVVHPEGSSGPDKLRHLVPGRGVEPLRPHGQRILSAPRLPFRHPGQLAHCGTKLASEHIMLM